MKRTTTTSCGLAGLLMLAISMGCTSTYGGGGLGSHMEDEVVYFAPGPEFKIANESAATKAAAEEAAAGANSAAEAATAETKR